MMLKKTLATVGTAGVLTAGSMGMATPAQAAPLVTGGLVNVTVTDVLNNLTVTVQDINVGVALGLAANICDVNVSVLAQQLRTGSATCAAAAGPVSIVQA